MLKMKISINSMMTLKIRSNIPVKYYLNVHASDQLIDTDAVLFEILKYLIQVIQSKGKELSLDNLKFSTKTLKYVFGDRIKDETFKEKLVKSLKELLTSGKIVNKNDSFYVTEEAIKNFYIVSK